MPKRDARGQTLSPASGALIVTGAKCRREHLAAARKAQEDKEFLETEKEAARLAREAELQRAADQQVRGCATCTTLPPVLLARSLPLSIMVSWCLRQSTKPELVGLHLLCTRARGRR